MTTALRSLRSAVSSAHMEGPGSENALTLPPGKGHLQPGQEGGGGGLKMRGLPGRAALGDIGNNAAPLNRGGMNAKKDGLIRKEPLKPARALAKQKGTSNLLPAQPHVEHPLVGGPTTRSKSMSSPEPMEVVEMAETASHGVMEVETDGFHGVNKSIPGPVEDIDEDDRENPQLAADYVNEIYAYMRELEARQNIRENYLALQGGKVVIKPKMRNLLVDWMVDVHTQFSLLQETLYLSVAILDRFLQVKASTLTTKQLQLVGVSAMFVASKYEEMYPPEIGDFVYITDKAYTESQIRKMEITIISSLDFELGRPLPLNFLRRNSKAGFVDAQAHTLAKYVMELSLVEYRMAHVPPSVLAGDFVYITDKAYTESQIRKMEITIISSLDFELGRPLPLNFLRRNSKAGFVDAQAHTLAKYVMELSLVEYRMAHVPPSVLAAASLGFAMKVLDSSNASLVDLWTPTLVHYTSYTLEDIASSLMAIADIVQSINTEDDNNAQTESGTSSSSSSSSSKKRLRAVKTKYSSKKFIKIALLPQLRESVTKQMAEGHF
ncbi:hypothetical protein TCAL_04549 [Tigriopus californicus]|uniref:Uncharacterized protein n=1 Tax=Tigriopus californicus TaxID=6832 RepID=A0A553PTS4_TIGCA|nr:hypothetical protein TCAL_04549 [Tigriopus californicus]